MDQYDTSYPSMWLKLFGEVVPLHILLFSKKNVKSSYEKFRKKKKRENLTCRCMMVI